MRFEEGSYFKGLIFLYQFYNTLKRNTIYFPDGENTDKFIYYDFMWDEYFTNFPKRNKTHYVTLYLKNTIFKALTTP